MGSVEDGDFDEIKEKIQTYIEDID